MAGFRRCAARLPARTGPRLLSARRRFRSGAGAATEVVPCRTSWPGVGSNDGSAPALSGSARGNPDAREHQQERHEGAPPTGASHVTRPPEHDPVSMDRQYDGARRHLHQLPTAQRERKERGLGMDQARDACRLRQRTSWSHEVGTGNSRTTGAETAITCATSGRRRATIAAITALAQAIRPCSAPVRPERAAPGPNPRPRPPRARAGYRWQETAAPRRPTSARNATALPTSTSSAPATTESARTAAEAGRVSFGPQLGDHSGGKGDS